MNMNFFYFLLGLFLLFGCRSTYTLIEVDNELGDDTIYRNHELNLDIQQKYLSILYPRVKGSGYHLYNKKIKFDKLRTFGCNQLVYAEHFDKTRFGFLAESYSKPIPVNFIKAKLKNRKFKAIKVLDSLENNITYSQRF